MKLSVILLSLYLFSSQYTLNAAPEKKQKYTDLLRKELAIIVPLQQNEASENKKRVNRKVSSPGALPVRPTYETPSVAKTMLPLIIHYDMSCDSVPSRHSNSKWRGLKQAINTCSHAVMLDLEAEYKETEQTRKATIIFEKHGNELSTVELLKPTNQATSLNFSLITISISQLLKKESSLGMLSKAEINVPNQSRAFACKINNIEDSILTLVNSSK